MPGTHLYLDGVADEEVTAEFLTELLDLAEDHDLSPDGISVLRRDTADSSDG